MSSIVIIGAGECGGRAALQLRERGYDGAVTLIGDERHAPYERPPLSKDGILSGSDPKFIAAAAEYADRGIDLRTEVTATRIDRAKKLVSISDGSALPYTRLLLATGARPRLLPGHPVSARVFTLRSHSDALAIKPHLASGKRVAIIGGGFIGLELAAAARGLGASVTLVEGLPRLLSRGVPPEIAEVVTARHLAAGVNILCGVRIHALEQLETAIRVRLADGQVVEADSVVVGIGSLPNAELAADAGLAIENGIAVDEFLRTSDPEIFAAGDCCSFPVDVYGGRRIRLESWRSAQEQAMVAAANLTDANEPLRTVPWFWSDQYELTLQVAGLGEGAARAIRRDMGGDSFIIFQLDERDRLLAASGIGSGNAVARDIRLAEMLIARGAVIDAAALAAPDVKL
jgi:3-phenylpropionate/trans-cinnamate dioxygenase ferredoxin reductase subunit